MKQKLLLSLLFAGLLLVLISGCNSTQPQQWIIVTGGESGTYYPIGGAIAQVINNNLKEVEAEAQVSDGSVANINSLSADSAELGLIENSIAYYAEQGTQMFEGQSIDNIRGIASLYPEVIQIVTLQEYGINSLFDLQGKTVGIGAPGSGTAVNMLEIFKLADLNEDNVDIQYLNFTECVEALKAGSIQAGCIVAGWPTSAVTEIAGLRSIDLVEIPPDFLAGLADAYPFYTSAEIPSGTYPGVTKAVDSVAVEALLAARADLSEDLVYTVTRALFEHTDVLAAAHARGKDISLGSALEGMSILLHPGARQYYQEKGLILP